MGTTNITRTAVADRARLFVTPLDQGGGGGDEVREHGTEGNDTLDGSAGDDRLWGEGGDDVLNGLEGDDRLEGGEGDDTINAGSGSDRVDDDAGDNVVNSDNGANADRADVDIRLGDGADTVNFVGGALTRAEIRTGNGADVITLDGGVNVRLRDGGGDDVINILDGADRFRLKLGGGHDTITVAAGAELGGSFRDATRIDNFAPGADGDVLDLSGFLTTALSNWDGVSNPFDTGHLEIVQTGDNVIVRIDADGGGDAWTRVAYFNDADATLFTAENFAGWTPVVGEGDVFTGDDDGETHHGDETDDDLDGGGGDDDLTGGMGDDDVDGQGDDDDCNGGKGDDTVGGGTGDDTVTGGDGDDDVDGDKGDDDVNGGDGDDDVNGGGGDDDVNGGGGDDTIAGGGGDDTLTGGAGSDDFVFTKADGSTIEVTDFEVGKDVFDLSAIDADAGTAGDQAFTFVGAFSNAAGQATLSYDAGTDLTTAMFDVNGDGVADLTLLITGEVTTSDGWVL